MFSVMICTVPEKAECSEYTVDKVTDLIDGIVSYRLSQTGSGSIQEWINGEITENAGTLSEWYAITLSQNGYTDMSSYENALKNYLHSNDILSASSRLKYALALSAAGSTDSLITEYLDNATGQQGIMSWIYGLHLLNNGYTSAVYTKGSVISTLLSLQLQDGGWALFGEYGDIDVTAMTVNALAPSADSDADVQSAVDRALSFLSEHQESDGGYRSFGTANPESASQVLTALSALGIDCQYDERFIKNDSTVIDGISAYRDECGAFRHTSDGDINDTATVQAYYSLTAYRRMRNGQSPLFILDNRKYPEAVTGSAAVTEPEVSSGDDPKTTEARSSSETKENISETSSVTTVGVTSSVSSPSSASSVSSFTSPVSSSYASENVSSSLLSASTVTEETIPGKNDQQQIHNDKRSESKSYKPLAVIIILSAGAVVSLILFISGKRNRKNFIFILIIAAGAVLFVLFTDFRSADSYYDPESHTKENAAGKVTIEIRCDTIIGKSDKDYIPEDGVILPKSEIEIEDGDTVFDVLTDAAGIYGIQMENSGTSGGAHGMAYISGINYIYEFDFGDLSGWVYHVNGITPSIGCGEYVVSDGDYIEWLYTCELGHDLNEVYE